MAQYRQSGIERYFSHHGGDGSGGVGSSNGGGADQVAIRIPHKAGRIRRSRHDKALRKFSVPCIAFVLFLGLLVTLFAFHFLSTDKDLSGRFGDDEEPNGELKHGITFGLHYGYNHSTPSRELRFGRGSISGGRDSRYWDTDDRRRDDEYDEDVLELPGITSGNDHKENVQQNKEKRTSGNFNAEQKPGGLYNEAGRDELHKFEEEYKESLKDGNQVTSQADEAGDANLLDEYDDGIDVEDNFGDGSDEPEHDEEDHPAHQKHPGSHVLVENAGGRIEGNRFKKDVSAISLGSSSTKMHGHGQAGVKSDSHSGKSLAIEKKNISKGKPKRRKHSGSCEMKLLNSSHLLEPLVTKKFSRFSLRYTEIEDKPVGVDNWEPRFAGHQTLQEREDSFYARDQTINCGFVKSPKGFSSTGFDLAEDDMKFMSSCHIAVSSCIFGNSDHLRTPYNKMITRMSRKNVCFVMFVDEQTLQTLSAEGQKPDSTGFVGLWKVVVVNNLPYDDMRRVGKIPKFLTHRLFPSARYSIWLDSKLRLQSDPLLILEYFLWRKGHEYAISNHYDRHCVWEEVVQNKKLNKFNHTIIDEQFAFYQADGLKKFDPLDPNKLLPSYVPEGSFILRAHTPMSNLFSCLWFNEVDRFTPRDQLSFAYTYLKFRRMNPDKQFYLHMFKDCERRSIAKLFHHRSEDKKKNQLQAAE